MVGGVRRRKENRHFAASFCFTTFFSSAAGRGGRGEKEFFFQTIRVLIVILTRAVGGRGGGGAGKNVYLLNKNKETVSSWLSSTTYSAPKGGEGGYISSGGADRTYDFDEEGRKKKGGCLLHSCKVQTPLFEQLLQERGKEGGYAQPIHLLFLGEVSRETRPANEPAGERGRKVE